MENISLYRFIHLCVKEAIRTTWEKSDLGATIFGIIIPVVIHFVPAWEHALNNVLWEIPIACLASVGATRLILSPFLIYRAKELECLSLKERLAAFHSEEDLQAILGEFYRKGAELRLEIIASEAELEAWMPRFNEWRDGVIDALEQFGMAADHALFQNADASGVHVLPPEEYWYAEAARQDRILQKCQGVLAEILRARPRLR